MRPAYANNENLQKFITLALQEDIGTGDHSTLAAVPETAQGKAQLLVKDEGILAGVELAKMIFHTIDSSLQIQTLIPDGLKIKKGDVALYIQGKARSILQAERLVLNCMQRMSGIATYTHFLKQKIAHTKAQLLDTRKTTPNFRICEKWAVHIGGGQNHRLGLYDMIMLKDNHIDYAGGIAKAIEATHRYLQENQLSLRIEIETRNLKEVQEVLAIGGVDVIMLDNMSLSEMQKAVEIIAGKYLTEASGGITEENIVNIAECGVDFISVGALTHSVKSLDISLKAIKD